MRDRRFVGAIGFTLIELMIVVAIIGVLAALAVVGVRRYVVYARSTEPRNALGQMAKDAATAYARESMAANVLAARGTSGVAASLCSTASQSVPSTIAKIAARKYQSAPTNWNRDEATANKGFACLKFGMTDPQYYMYNYLRPTAATFTAQANGDLDGDGTTSTFALYGSVYGASTDSKVVFIAPTIYEFAAEE